MIVGNGLIAKALDRYANSDDILIFASGVSNSSEITPETYQREIDLLLSFKNTTQRLIYFSTCSIYDQSLQQSIYVLHKLNVEKIIEANFSKYLILRLPNLIGQTANPNTMFNYFKSSILNNKSVNIQRNAHRYLLGIDDLISLFPLILKMNTQNILMDVAIDNKQSVLSIYLAIANILGVIPNYSLVAGGNEYTLDLPFLKNIEPENNLKLDSYNIHLLINKYL